MATRYVWQKSNTTQVTANTVSGSSNYQGRVNLNILNSSDITSGTMYFRVGTGISIQNGKFIINSAETVTPNYHDFIAWGDSGDTSIDVYFGVSSNSSTTTFERAYRITGYSSNTGGAGSSFLLRIGYNASSEIMFLETNQGSLGQCSGTAYEYTVGKGSAVGYVSNSTSSAYPTDGGSGSYWYTYQGSDSIDATAVGYSTQAPMGGQPITINVTPATPTYGGTIQYTYQVQLSGGSWTTIATKTTATSQQYTIPAGTTSFAARVVANDTWGFSSSTYTTGSTITVTNNLPPTAPGSISIGSVVGGQQCTITWTAATDPDGTIASYQLERQVDNGNTWTQIYSGAALTYTDTIDADWATVNYRVKATDDDGDSGPYVTGTMQTVNSGWLYFSGPPADMGPQPAPFAFVFSIGSTGASPATNISVAVIYDDETIYTGTVDADEQITLNIDTRLTYAGDHDIIVTASADGFLAVTQQCDFTVPSVTLPNGGAAGFMEDDNGDTYYPATLARYVIGLKGLDANALFDRVYTGTYTGTGTSGSGNPCSVRTSFEPILVFIQAAAASTATSGYWVNSAPGQSSQGNMIVNNNGTVTLCPVTWDAEAMTLSWYGTSAAAQLNASGTVYGIIALGGMA